MPAEHEVLVRLRVSNEGKLELVDFEQRLAGLGKSAEGTGIGFGELGVRMSNMARQGSTALMRWEISTLALENAQDRVLQAQERVTYAVQRYGAGSREATAAQRNLEIYTRSLEVAQQRLYIRMAFATLTVVPSMISQAKRLINVFGDVSKSTDVLTSSTWRNTIANIANWASRHPFLALAAGVAVAGAAAYAYSAFGAQAQEPASNTVNVYGTQNFGAPSSMAEYQQMQAQMQQARGSRT